MIAATDERREGMLFLFNKDKDNMKLNFFNQMKILFVKQHEENNIYLSQRLLAKYFDVIICTREADDRYDIYHLHRKIKKSDCSCEHRGPLCLLTNDVITFKHGENMHDLRNILSKFSLQNQSFRHPMNKDDVDEYTCSDEEFLENCLQKERVRWRHFSRIRTPGWRSYAMKKIEKYGQM